VGSTASGLSRNEESQRIDLYRSRGKVVDDGGSGAPKKVEDRWRGADGGRNGQATGEVGVRMGLRYAAG